jgi:serine/threonine-protein kinase
MFSPGSAQRRLVDALLDPDARLLVSDAERDGNPTVRVAHEALISRWTRAQEFVQRNAEALKIRRRIEERYALWRDLKCATSGETNKSGLSARFSTWRSRFRQEPGLLSDIDLTDGLRLLKEHGTETDRDLVAYIGNSIAADKRARSRSFRALASVASVVALLAIFASAASVLASKKQTEAERQTLRAEAEARNANETTRFLVDLFKIWDPSEARGNTVTAREMLDKGAARINNELAKAPAIQATLMDTLGMVYMGLGLYDQARPLLKQAVTTRRSLQAVAPGELSDSLGHEGELLFRVADYAAAERDYRDAIHIELARPQDPESQARLADSLFGLGKLLSVEGQFAEAEKDLREALKLQERLYGTSDSRVAATLKVLAVELSDGGNLNDAIPLMRSAVAMQRQLHGYEPYPDLAEVLNDMGVLLYRNGDLDEAERFYRESLAMNRKLFGGVHPEIATSLENVAMSLQDKGDLTAAEDMYRQSLAMRRELMGENHPDVARTLLNLASLQYDRGNTGEALANMREVLAIYRKVYPADHPETARVMNAIGFWLTLAHDYPQADHYMIEALTMRRRLFDENSPDVASSLSNMALLRIAEVRFPEALELAQSAKCIDTEALSADHWRTAIAESAEGAALTGLGRYREAEISLTHSYSILSKNSGAPLIYRNLARGYLDALHRSAHGSVARSNNASVSKASP